MAPAHTSASPCRADTIHVKQPLSLLATILLCLALGACSMIEIQWPPAEDTSVPETVETEENGSAETGNGDNGAPATDIEIVEADTPPAPDVLLEDYLHFAHEWLGKSETSRRQDYTAAERAYDSEPSSPNLMRLALLTALTHPDRPGTNDRVRDELRKWIASGNNEVERNHLLSSAVILLHVLDERENLLTQLTARTRELQGKLDELKAIEQELRERDSTDIIRTLP